MSKKLLAAGLAVLLASPAWPQARQPASITTIPSLTPQEFDILDSAGAWRALGYSGATQFRAANVQNALNVLDGRWGPASCGGSACPTGTGGDDSVPINAAIAQAVADNGNKVYFPPPPSGYYNVCASHLVVGPSGTTAHTTVTLEMANSGGYSIRILPTCVSPPNEVLYDAGNSYPSLADKSRGRMRLSNMRLDAWCKALHDLTIGYDPGASVENSVFLNAAKGGSNVVINSGYEYYFDKATLIKNINTPENPSCYANVGDFPAFGVEMYGTDSHFDLTTVNTEFAGIAAMVGGDNMMMGSHTWNYPALANGDGQPQAPGAYGYYLVGSQILISPRSDDPQLAMFRVVRQPGAGNVVPGRVGIVSVGSGGTPGWQTLTGTTGAGAKATVLVWVANGKINGPGLVINEGVYTTNPTNPAVEPMTGGGLTGVTVALAMGSGPNYGVGPVIVGGAVAYTGASPASSYGLSLGDGIFTGLMTNMYFAGLSASTNCVKADTLPLNPLIVIKNNVYCATETTAPLTSLTINGSIGNVIFPPTGDTLSFTNNGGNYIDANGGSLAQLIFEVNNAVPFSLTPIGAHFPLGLDVAGTLGTARLQGNGDTLSYSYNGPNYITANSGSASEIHFQANNQEVGVFSSTGGYFPLGINNGVGHGFSVDGSGNVTATSLPITSVSGGNALTMSFVRGVNFNATGDTVLPIVLSKGSVNYTPNAVQFFNCSAVPSATVRAGIYSAVSQGGNALLGQTALNTITSISPNTVINTATPTLATTAVLYNQPNLYVNVGTSNGSALTCDVGLQARML